MLRLEARPQPSQAMIPQIGEWMSGLWQAPLHSAVEA